MSGLGAGDEIRDGRDRDDIGEDEYGGYDYDDDELQGSIDLLFCFCPCFVGWGSCSFLFLFLFLNLLVFDNAAMYQSWFV